MSGIEDEPDPQRRRKKEGESDRGIVQMARRFSRHLFVARALRRHASMRSAENVVDFHDEREKVTGRGFIIPGAELVAAAEFVEDSFEQFMQMQITEDYESFDEEPGSWHNYGSLDL